MSQLNLVWSPGLYFSDTPGHHCKALGYVFELYAFGDTGYRAYGRDAADTDSFEIVLDAESLTVAKLAVDAWLAKQIADTTPKDPIAAALSASGYGFVDGAKYVQLFEDIVALRLGRDPNIEVMPYATSDGLTGRYFRNYGAGLGVKVIHCARDRLLLMFMGTNEQLDSEYRCEPYYFYVPDLVHNAQLAMDFLTK